MNKTLEKQNKVINELNDKIVLAIKDYLNSEGASFPCVMGVLSQRILHLYEFAKKLDNPSEYLKESASYIG